MWRLPVRYTSKCVWLGRACFTKVHAHVAHGPCACSGRRARGGPAAADCPGAHRPQHFVAAPTCSQAVGAGGCAQRRSGCAARRSLARRLRLSHAGAGWGLRLAGAQRAARTVHEGLPAVRPVVILQLQHALVSLRRPVAAVLLWRPTSGGLAGSGLALRLLRLAHTADTGVYCASSAACSLALAAARSCDHCAPGVLQRLCSYKFADLDDPGKQRTEAAAGGLLCASPRCSGTVGPAHAGKLKQCKTLIGDSRNN